MVELAARDERVVLLMGDIGNRLFDEFKDQFPERFYNCGIAEANMVSMAAGMAMSGLRPYCYTIAPFITTRCLEQVRVDLCYHRQPVVLVGVGSGLCYAELGATHESCEDIAHMRVLPNMAVLCPADVAELRAMLPVTLSHDGAIYIRLGKKGEQSVHTDPLDFEIGKAYPLRQGRDVAIMVTGVIAPLAIEVANQLEHTGLTCEVVSCPSIKPMDHGTLDRLFSSFRLVATLEEHSLLGGMGGVVSEWLVDQSNRHHAKLLRFGTADHYLDTAGGQTEARTEYGLDSRTISDKIARAYPRAIPMTGAA